ncbi:hypothetical protein K504DRAFT_460489 [Pleomassaria siparia CBS 279.74]|uniref:Uncharacterized protein n=1 Tax=Pleomassaria siparia CBS 279.74 TaxID=1314801 RepID=A0A6G1JX92_9PLEO|nr:hypothetical protein K504DRAFT_460489 [Pleomassaria siparia CBS 279.74]
MAAFALAVSAETILPITQVSSHICTRFVLSMEYITDRLISRSPTVRSRLLLPPLYPLLPLAWLSPLSSYPLSSSPLPLKPRSLVVVSQTALDSLENMT